MLPVFALDFRGNNVEFVGWDGMGYTEFGAWRPNAGNCAYHIMPGARLVLGLDMIQLLARVSILVS